jgi:hypothetical protein
MARNGLIRRIAGWLVATASLGALVGCTSESHWHYWSIVDASAPLPSWSEADPMGRRAAMPAELLEVDLNGNQTVLIAAKISQDRKQPDDVSSYSFVAIIDGPAEPGKYEITPANGRFVENSSWEPARKPYKGAEGYVKIHSVTDDVIEAYCNLRNSYATAEPRYILRGKFEFETVQENFHLLNSVGIRVSGIPQPKEEPK